MFTNFILERGRVLFEEKTAGVKFWTILRLDIHITLKEKL